MKQLLSLLLTLALTTTATAQIQPPAPKPPVPAVAVPAKAIVPLTMSVRAGELIVIDAKAAKGDVLFVYDTKTFDAKHAMKVGKALILTAPTVKDSAVYNVVVTSWDDRTQDQVAVTVIGTDGPPPIDPSATPIEKLGAKLDAFIAANAIAQAKAAADMKAWVLTQVKPIPPPVNALVKHVTFVGAEINATSLAVNNDATLRTFFTNAGAKVHVLKKDDPLIASKGLAVAVAKAGGAPCIVLQDELGNVIAQGPVTTVSAAEDMAAPFIRR